MLCRKIWPKNPQWVKPKVTVVRRNFLHGYKTVFTKLDLDFHIIHIAENYSCHFVTFVKVTLNNDLWFLTRFKIAEQKWNSNKTACYCLYKLVTVIKSLTYLTNFTLTLTAIKKKKTLCKNLSNNFQQISKNLFNKTLCLHWCSNKFNSY